MWYTLGKLRPNWMEVDEPLGLDGVRDDEEVELDVARDHGELVEGMD
jgi:hypothetical protein